MVFFLKDKKGTNWYLPVLEMKLEELHDAILTHEQAYHAGLSENRVLEMFEDAQTRVEDALQLIEQWKQAQQLAVSLERLN